MVMIMIMRQVRSIGYNFVLSSSSVFPVSRSSSSSQESKTAMSQRDFNDTSKQRKSKTKSNPWGPLCVQLWTLLYGSAKLHIIVIILCKIAIWVCKMGPSLQSESRESQATCRGGRAVQALLGEESRLLGLSVSVIRHSIQRRAP